MRPLEKLSLVLEGKSVFSSIKKLSVLSNSKIL